MAKSKHSIHTVAIAIPVLAICVVSLSTQAWLADTLAPWVGTMFDGRKCNGGQVAFGPYDYLQRDKDLAALEVVEESHFDEGVESLTKGMSSSPINDIHYTLMTWPNHHRALNSSVKYRLGHRGPWPDRGEGYPAECYLQRAIKFSPKDPIPYMLYGTLMHKMKKYAKALEAYQAANRLVPDDLITQYNMGLALVELKKYNQAEQVAKSVYRAGFPLPGLKNKLRAAGHWKAEPGVEKAAAAPTGRVATNPEDPKVKLTATQLEQLQQGMREEAARKNATNKKAVPETPVPANSAPLGNKGVDPSVAGE